MRPGSGAIQILLIMAGALTVSFLNLRGANLGFDRGGVLTAFDELQPLAAHARGDWDTDDGQQVDPQVLGGERRRRAPAADGSLVNAFARAGRWVRRPLQTAAGIGRSG